MKKLIAYDGFEEKELNSIWGHSRFEERSIKIQSKIKRKGKQAIQVTVRSMDTFEDNKGESNNTERDEVREQKYLWGKENSKYIYKFSMFLPKNFPIVPTRLVLAQWKQHDEDNTASVTNPVVAIRYEMGKFRITLQTSEEKIVLFRASDEIRGKWIDFVFEIKFSRTKKGILKAWINEKKVVDYKGITAYSKELGYPGSGIFHFRFGLYRDLMKKPMTAYYDEYYKYKVE
jgi:hypothetical protein